MQCGSPRSVSDGYENACSHSFDVSGKKRPISLAIVLASVLAFALPRPSFATLFAPSFAGPALDAGLATTGLRGTGITVGGGTLALDQAAGSGDGEISVTTSVPVNGDFVATVMASGVGLGRADLGLVVGSADWDYTLADVFLNDLAGTVNGNIFQPTFNGAFLPKSTETLTLTVIRRGNTLSDIFDAGAGSILINSGTDPSLGGSTNIGLFLLEAAGDTGAHHGTFTHFQLTSGSDTETTPLPEPATVGLLASGVLALCSVNILMRRKKRQEPSACCMAKGLS